MFKITSTLWLLFICIFCFAEDRESIQWAKNSSLSIQNNGYHIFNDLADQATIIGLGEADHALHEQTLARVPFTKYLVSQKGYRLIFMESGFLESFHVQKYIDGEINRYEDIIKGFTHNMGAWQEQKELINWLREWNKNHPDDPVYFFGADEPNTGTSIFSILNVISNELNFLLHDNKFSTIYKNIYDLSLKGNQIFKKVEEFYRKKGSSIEPDYLDAVVYFSIMELNKKEQTILFNQINELVKRAAYLIKDTQSFLYQKIYQLKLVSNSIKLRLKKPWNPYNKIVSSFLKIPYQDPDLSDPKKALKYWQEYQDARAGREYHLLNNVLWLQKKFKKKGVLFAHNGHLQKNLTDGADKGTSIGLGFLLNKKIKSKYKVIATTMNQFLLDNGEIATHWNNQPVLDVEYDDQTLEYYLLRSNCEGVCYFHLKKLPRFLKRPVKMRFSTSLFMTKIKEAYDGVLFFPTVTHGHSL